MSKIIRKIIFWFWPPYEAYLARLHIDSNAGKLEEKLRSIQNIRDVILKASKIPDEMEALAKLVFESENKRRDAIESKALGFISIFSVVVSIALALPVLFGGKWNIPAPLLWILGFIYILGVIYLVVAVYSSVMARSVDGMALPNVDDYINSVKNRKWKINDRIMVYLQQAKYNEPALNKKANSLVVAERVFVRGLVLISMAAIISGISLYFVDSKQGVACKVPNVIGLDYLAAEKMLFELGLQPILSNEYNSSVGYGSIIFQNPVAGSTMKPCNENVLLVFSLGARPIPTSSSIIPAIVSSPTQIPQPKSSTPAP